MNPNQNDVFPAYLNMNVFVFIVLVENSPNPPCWSLFTSTIFGYCLSPSNPFSAWCRSTKSLISSSDSISSSTKWLNINPSSHRSRSCCGTAVSTLSQYSGLSFFNFRAVLLLVQQYEAAVLVSAVCPGMYSQNSYSRFRVWSECESLRLFESADPLRKHIDFMAKSGDEISFHAQIITIKHVWNLKG